MADAARPIIFVNGKRYELTAGKADWTLLRYLREELRMTGTKLGCGEGGCGACTVMLSRWDAAAQSTVHRAVNACLMPLYASESCHVTTIEGIGSVEKGLHPVQAALAGHHGSQCGFCTPGFLMSMYTLLQEKKSTAKIAEHDVHNAIAGNLCRCTGYRPILDAFNTFAKSGTSAPLPNGHAAENGGHQGEAAGHVNGTNGTCHANGTNGADKLASEASCKKGCGAATGAEAAAAWSLASERSFPEELRARVPPELDLPGSGCRWRRPLDLATLLKLKAETPAAKIVCGATEVAVEQRLSRKPYQELLSPTSCSELYKLETSADGTGVLLGAAASLTDVAEFLSGLAAARRGSAKAHEARTLQAVLDQLRWFAGGQVRNVASLGGNIATGSPISDLGPVWLACGAAFEAASSERGARRILAKDFYLAYRKTALLPDEVLTAVCLPFGKPFEYVRAYKQAHRREDDIAIATACFRLQVAPPAAPGTTWTVVEASLGYGGVAPTTILAHEAAEALVMCPAGLSEAALNAALTSLREKDIKLDSSSPGGMPAYRMGLTQSFLFKFFCSLCLDLEKDAAATPAKFQAAALGVTAADEDAAGPAFSERAPQKGLQVYSNQAVSGAIPSVVPVAGGSPSGISQQHMSASLQCTGEARYTDDIREPSGCLHAALVYCGDAHCEVKGIDASAALAVEGVVAFFTAADVPGGNDIGAVIHDETLFTPIGGKASNMKQAVGVVVATSRAKAAQASRLVKVDVQSLPRVMTIEDAIEADSFHNNFATNHKVVKGDPVKALSECDVVVEGELRMGGQEHFYLEPNSALCIPGEAGEMVNIASTQALTKHQQTLAHVLGVPAHKVVAKTKRIGGGFGGKESRSCYVSAAAAVAAYRLDAPVKLILERDEDMAGSGHRHPFLARYRAGCTKEGRLVALDCDIFSNAGDSLDLSGAVMDRALLLLENCYHFEHLAARGRCCFTHTPSNTAFRGFGGPQGMLIAEDVIERLSAACGLDSHAMRQRNLYRPGGPSRTPYGQEIEGVESMVRCWDEVLASSEYERRRAECETFNQGHKWRKRAMGALPTKYGISFTTKFLNQAGSLVHLYTDGTVLVNHGGVEMGQGLHTKCCQLAAAEFGLPLEKVFIEETSTDKVANSSPSAASACSDMYGAATVNACRIITERLKPYRERLGPTAGLADVARAAYMDRVDLSAHGFYATPDIGGFGTERPFAYYTFGAAVSEVELDVLTGDLRILRADVCMDLGIPINPAIDVGQIEGAFAQGMGLYLLEELKWGDSQHAWARPGKLVTDGPGSYKIPAADDCPSDFRVQLLDGCRNARAVSSSKAVGEPPLFLAASAWLAARRAASAARAEVDGGATYVQIHAPATPERLRLACGGPMIAEGAAALLSC